MFADWHWALFGRGVVSGLTIALPAVVALLALRWLRVPPPAVWGLLVAAAFARAVGAVGLGLELTTGPHPSIPAASTWVLAALGLGLLGASWLPGQPLQAAVAGLVAQTVLAHTDAIQALGDTGLALAGLVPVAALAVSVCDDRFPGLGPGMLTVSLAGVYLAVPDTELAFPLLGAALGLVALGAPLTRMRIGGIGSAVAVAALFWVVAVEAIGRPGSAVGAVGCLGMLVMEPAARLLSARRAPAPTTEGERSGPKPGRRMRSTLWLLGPHAAIVAVASRLVSLSASPVVALGALVPVLGAGLAVSLYRARAMPEASCGPPPHAIS